MPPFEDSEYANLVIAHGATMAFPMQELDGDLPTDVANCMAALPGNGIDALHLAGSLAGMREFAGPCGIDDFRYSYRFDGQSSSNDWLLLTGSGQPTVASTRCVEAIIRPEAVDVDLGPIIDHAMYNPQFVFNFPMRLFIGVDDKLYWQLSKGDDFTVDLSLNADIELDEWHHVAATYDPTMGNECALLIDGEIVATGSSPGALTNDGNWRIGASQDFGGGSGLARYKGDMIWPAWYEIDNTYEQIAERATAWCKSSGGVWIMDG